MVTTLTNDKVYNFFGLSTDTKPTNIENGKKIGNGSTYVELDTSKRFIFDEENNIWYETTLTLGDLSI